MIDLSAGGSHAGLTLANAANNFVFKIGNNNSPGDWSPAPAPAAISVIPGAGTSGSDRVEITWASGAIRNQWLEVQVLATAQTGLEAPDVFFWGSRVADSGTSPGAATFETTTTDAAQVFATLGGSKPIIDVRDYNRDGSVNTTDAALVFANLGSLTRIAIGGAGPFSPLSDGFAAIATAVAQSFSPSPSSPTIQMGSQIVWAAATPAIRRPAPSLAQSSCTTEISNVRQAVFNSSTDKSHSPDLNWRLGHEFNRYAVIDDNSRADERGLEG